MIQLSNRRAAILIAVLAAAVYVNTLWNGFAFDDVHIIVENERVHGIDRVGEAFLSPYWPNSPARMALYRPLATAMYAVEWDLWNASPVGYHAVNVVLHAAVSVLVLLLLLRLRAPLGAALAGSAVFAVHPVHVEAVANVVGRAELLAALFYLAAVLLYLRLAPCSWPRALAIGVAYFLGLAAKEMDVTLPAALLLLELARRRDSAGWGERVAREWRVVFTTTVALAAYVALRWQVTGEAVGNDVEATLASQTTGERMLTVLHLWPEYARLLFFPVDLVADYSPGVLVPPSGFEATVIAGILLGSSVAIGAVLAWRRAPMITLGIAWFAVTIFPVSNLVVPVGILLAERTLYLPSVGLALGVAGLICARPLAEPARRRLVTTILVLIITAAAIRTWVRNPVWRSTRSVIQNLAETHPESFRVHWAYASSLEEAGRREDSLDFFKRAAELVPGHYALLRDYGRALYRLQHWGEAAEVFEQAVRSIPEHRLTHLYLVNSLLRAGRPENAVGAIENALERFPEDAELLDQAAHAYAAIGAWELALYAREENLRIRGDDLRWSEWLHLAMIQAHLGNVEAAHGALLSASNVAPPSITLPTLTELTGGVAALAQEPQLEHSST